MLAPRPLTSGVCARSPSSFRLRARCLPKLRSGGRLRVGLLRQAGGLLLLLSGLLDPSRRDELRIHVAGWIASGVLVEFEVCQAKGPAIWEAKLHHAAV